MDKEAREQIEELLAVGSLSKWEDSFLTTIAARLDAGYPLTQAQQEKLDEIIDAKLR